MIEPSTVDAFFCGDIGFNPGSPDCCAKDPANSCDNVFPPEDNWFATGCANTGNCAIDCQNTTYIYSFAFNPDNVAVNPAAIRPWTTCANVPNVVGLINQGLVAPNITKYVQEYVPENITTEEVSGITKAVTSCLTATCQLARNPDICSDQCSSINLLINSSMPNYDGMNSCLYTLCNGGFDAVPFANADIVGIGVFSSYVMQCGFALLLWMLFAILTLLIQSRWSRLNHVKVVRQRKALVTGLIEFHKTQCFFSSTIQAAALAYGLFDTNFLTIFLVIPLATNGIIPVVFGLLLISRFGNRSVYLTTLTCISWLLSSLVYWSLYMHVTKVDWHHSQYDVYQATMFTLSSNDECGGFSALTACPEDMILGEQKIDKGSDRIRFYTPALWAWGTLVLFILVGHQIFHWFQNMPTDNALGERARYIRRVARQDRAGMTTPFFRMILSRDGIFWTSTLVFVALIGLQLALLYIEAGIEFFDSSDWSFGQIVAVAIWVPPFVEYLWVQLKGIEKSMSYRLAKGDKMTRTQPNESSAQNRRSTKPGEPPQREFSILNNQKNV